MPSPCSPKSIYLLAKLLGIQPLCERALADIKSKVSADNVVDEVFSLVTANHNEIMEMQCDLLMSNSKDPKTMGLVKGNIGSISDGSLSYCGDSLKLGLWKAFDLQKQKPQLPGVKLQCTGGWCALAGIHPSYSSIGSTIHCQWCINAGRGQWHLRCIGCGNNRTGSYASCQACGKRFV